MSPFTSSNPPESNTNSVNGFILGLASSGVCLAAMITHYAVRSYRTFSPLPLVLQKGGLFSVALSIGSHRPDVIWRCVL